MSTHPADSASSQEDESPWRVTFVHAPNRFFSEIQNNGVIFMPVWAYTLAAHLPEDGRYATSLLDIRANSLSEIGEADLFLFSGINQDYPELVSTRDEIAARFPTARFVIGGPICGSFNTAGDLEKLAMFDHIVIGDGEAIIADLVERLKSGVTVEKIIRNNDRFVLAQARPMDPGLMDATISNYYGAVVEVARGCPFLCEFCDIRILPDNNRTHVKSASVIVEEVDHICRLGVQNFLFACDNFIGDLRWAEEVVDALIAWRERTGFKPVFYTWLTINLYKSPKLMTKMRRAGFDVLFIGVESFNTNSLLETAKVQNSSAGVVGAVQEIQSFGFPIVAGIIFGFDSDDLSSFQSTREGLLDSGLLSGDPSLLTALPGTPLFRRMRLAGRLRDNKYGLGGYKYHTNIRYLIPRDELIENYLEFCNFLIDGSQQYARLERFFDVLKRGNYVPLDGESYFSLKQAVSLIVRNPVAVRLALRRLWAFFANPSNVWYALKGAWLTYRTSGLEGRAAYFKFWIAVWTTLIVKYRDVKESDFDIQSVEGPVRPEQIIPDAYETEWDEPIPETKIRAQRRETTRSLRELIALKTENS